MKTYVLIGGERDAAHMEVCLYDAENGTFGKLVAATGSYMLTFVMGAATALVNIGIFIVISRCLKKQKG